MNEQEAYEAWFRGEQGKPYDGAHGFACAAWHAALAWLRSQGEPVAHLAPEGYDDDPVPVFLAPQPAIPDGWREAIESISEFGDDTLCDEAFHAIRADKDAAEMALRIAVRLTKEEAIEKLEKLAAPEPSK